MRATSVVRASVLMLMAIVFVSGVHAQSADAIAQRLNAKYGELESLRADFTQTMTSDYSDLQDQKSGSLLLRGDDYLLDTGNETYARRGDELWRYSRADDQVVISDYLDDESSFSVNDLFFRYDELFNITDVRSESYEGSRHYRMTMLPRQDDSFFREVTLWMRNSDDIVTRVRMVDLNGTSMDFRLEDVQLNPRLQRDAFAPPSDAEVVNLR